MCVSKRDIHSNKPRFFPRRVRDSEREYTLCERETEIFLFKLTLIVPMNPSGRLLTA